MKLPDYAYRNSPESASKLISWGRIIIAAFLGIGLSQCSSPEKSYESSVQADVDSNSNTVIQYAEGFDVEYKDTYKLVCIYSSNDTLCYLLLPIEASIPAGVPFDQLISVPVERIVTQSTTHLGFICALDARNTVIGVDNASYIYDSIFTQAVAEGKIQEVGSGASLNAERLVALQPDVLLVSSMPDTGLDAYQKFIDLGIPVLPVAEWMEASPLGKAEWIKLFAALLNQEEQASVHFSQITQAYDSLLAVGKRVNEPTSVIVGSPFQGSWYVPGAISYRGALIRQAGGTWDWSLDSSAVSFPVDFEQMYEYGLNANVWLDPGQAFTKEELLGLDARFADFEAFQENQIYNSNRRLNASQSGNDYYESGAVYPQRILADLLKILHPELLPHHELYYYQPIR
jgi:iron complex transport system substrate-binding protein